MFNNLVDKNIFSLIKEQGKTIHVYFALKSTGDDYCSEEKNYTYTNLNPKTIKGYVSSVSPEKLVWRQYGLSETGAVEVLTSDRYIEWFKKANRIVIDNVDYSVYKVGSDNRVLIDRRAGGLIRVILQKKG
jgi:hypothetical protein